MKHNRTRALWLALLCAGAPSLFAVGSPAERLPFEAVPAFPLARPAIPPDVKIGQLSGVAVAGDQLFYAASWPEGEKTAKGLFVHNIKDGAARRVELGESVVGLATAPGAQALYVRTTKRLLVLDTGDLSQKSAQPFERTNSWADMTVNGSLLILRQNRLRSYDLSNGGLKSESRELPLAKTQRVLACGGRLFLWSSYSGARLFPYNAAANELLRPLFVAVKHRSLFRLACHQGTPAVFDERAGTHVTLYEFAGRLVPRTEGLFVLPDGGALRSNPRRDALSFELHVDPSADSSGAHAIVLLPPKYTIGQEIVDEQFMKAAELRLDRDGNRALFVELPALKQGVPFQLVVYRAKLVRYQVDVDLSRYKTAVRQKPPTDLLHFTDDLPQLLLGDPEITNTKARLLSSAGSMEEYATSAFREVKSRLHYKGDRRFDPAPVVLKQGHGSCTEYTYALMALFRSAGIPARMAWNHLGLAEPSFNHKLPEFWHPNLGWLPAEALAPPATTPGTTHARHLIFAELRTPYQEWMGKGDRLVSLRRAKGKAELIVRTAPAAGEESSAAPGEARGETDGPVPVVRGRGARRVVE